MIIPAEVPNPVNVPSTAAISIGCPIIIGARNFIISVKTMVPIRPPIMARGRAPIESVASIDAKDIGVPPFAANLRTSDCQR